MIGDLLPIACSTHLGESLAFGAPPIVMIVALVVITLRGRRADARRDSAPLTSRSLVDHA